MKHKKSFLLTLLSLLLIGCQNNNYISYKEYIDIVKSQEQDQKDIFIFTSSACSHCQKIKPLINKVIDNQEEFDFKVYELTVDQKTTLSNKRIPFSDKTMGYLTGNSEDDGLKALDNRIAKYVKATNADSQLIASVSSGKYSYILTPLVIWYESGIEVKIVNSVEPQLKSDDKGNITYESFVEFLTFPEDKPNWNEEFDLTSY